MKKFKPIIIIILVLFIFISGTYSGIYLHREYNFTSLKVFLVDKFRVNNFLRGFKGKPENLKLIIKDKDLKTIHEYRKTAIKNGVISENLKNYFEAKCIFNTDTFPAKIKIKGDFPDHLAGEKISFRIKLKNKKLIKGMSSFSIQDPKTRNYIYEWVFHQFFKLEKITSLKYFFLNVIVNDEEKGIYAIEEFFNNDMLISNKKQISPIIKISEENLFFENNCTHCKDHNELVDELYLKNDIQFYNKKSVLKDSNQRKLFVEAKELLSKFRSGDLTTHQVFNIQKTFKNICNF